jgi:predicted nucleic-acid-binding protein
VIGLDTHVNFRYVMQDDPRQASQATRLIESLTPEWPGFPSLTT